LEAAIMLAFIIHLVVSFSNLACKTTQLWWEKKNPDDQFKFVMIL